MHSNDMTCFKELESHLRCLYQNSFVHVEKLKQVEMAFLRFFSIFDSEEVTSSAGIASPILLENFKDYMGCKHETYRSNLLKYLDILAKCIDKRVYKYYEILVKEREVKEIKETGKLLNKTISHVHEIPKSFKLQSKDVLINSIQAVYASLVVMESKVKVDMGKELDDGLVVTESSEIESDKQDTSCRSGNDITHDEDVDIRPVYDQVPFAKVNSNTTPDSTNMCHRGGEIDQNAKKCQVSCPLLDPSSDNMTTKFSNQSLAFENISLKKIVAQLQKDFSRMETHCFNMELEYQNQALKDGQHGQILNKTSNKAKIKKEIEVLETINIELEHNTVMSDSKDSTVTYTEVSSLFTDLSDIRSPGVDGPPVMPEDPYAYVVATFQEPSSPDYVPGPEEPE
ncbi:hypothetical protein Tco_0878925 [Tanacetum coccineum]|uniref:Uncharacterized protein n=1 Tax=Tanacetum coccineum TaxID=301880 RepID=A0ABQ5C4N7_9ASTR